MKGHQHRIKRGLDLPILGKPSQVIKKGLKVKTVAIIGDDYFAMKPTMQVKEGDRVKIGEVLFTDKKQEGVCYTANGGGKVIKIHRGDKRVLESVVIELDGEEKERVFKKYSSSELKKIKADEVKELLLTSGLWTSIRVRPFGKVASPKKIGKSMFITATDTRPFAPKPSLVIEKHKKAFEDGVEVLSKLTHSKVYLCLEEDLSLSLNKKVEKHFLKDLIQQDLLGRIFILLTQLI